MRFKIKKEKKAFLKGLSQRPGVYRFSNSSGTVLYVGKAAKLKHRISSYFSAAATQPAKTRALMSHAEYVEITVTRTEAEALVLENNLIKQHRPRYNVLLKDDKSYPYIYLSSEQTYPRLRFHRGARTGKGRYFGPFPNAGSVRRTLNLIQKLFQVRSCEDTVFKNRSRPCLQHQIKRCTAPCVGLVSETEYRSDIEHAVMFLEGKNEEVIDALYGPMQQAANELDYEKAAHYRDQISNLRKVQEQELMSKLQGNVDVIACAATSEAACVQVFFIRNGMSLGNRAFFPGHTRNAEPGEILSAFLNQYYIGKGVSRKPPAEILLSSKIPDHDLLAGVLTTQAGYRVTIRSNVRSKKRKWLNMARQNAEISLKAKLSINENQSQRLSALARDLKLTELERIECFDISHTQGKQTVASCVVCSRNGLQNSEYRRFNISSIIPGDDYAAMQQALERRYTRVQKEEGILPDLILIDGGKGQVKSARSVLLELQLDHIRVVGVAKGPDRKPGQEKLMLADDHARIHLQADSPALHLIQQIRDEAHRFAITGHRQQRKKAATHSLLEEIPGVGHKRRQGLLQHFGGLQGVKRAGVDDLAVVPGINRQLAQKIYDALHES
ncbi:MAG: excinuclease ABC subunit UvrC [Thiotrichales bacterium]|nr:excinuclease ABC subunit UvrC [Thiotrichales bacterium]